jgi:CMP/dCMP kinase
MIVTLDGPAGAGKSTAARELARRLGFRFLDTGAMYRAVALAAARAGLDWNDSSALAQLAREITIELPGDRVLLNGDDVTAEIRTTDVTTQTKYAAANEGVREHMVELQRHLAGDQNVVTDGRDQGTIVFPQAECKIFLTASPEERARRRQLDLQSRGEDTPFAEVLRQQNERDEGDISREVGPMAAAADSIEIYTDGLNAEQVVDRLEELVRSKMRGPEHRIVGPEPLVEGGQQIDA